MDSPCWKTEEPNISVLTETDGVVLRKPGLALGALVKSKVRPLVVLFCALHQYHLIHSLRRSRSAFQTARS